MSGEFKEPSDDFERHARTWSAQERILAGCRAQAARYGLQHRLAELEDSYAAQEGRPGEMWWVELERFYEALAEAVEDEEGQ